MDGNKGTVDTKRRIAEEAVKNKMGVRYIRSKIKNLIEDCIFNDIEEDEYRIRV